MITNTRSMYATATGGVQSAAQILLPPSTLILACQITLAASFPTANPSPMWSQLILNNNLYAPNNNDNPGILASIMLANGVTGGTFGVSEWVPIQYRCNSVGPTQLYLVSSSASGANNTSYSHVVVYLA